MKRNPFAYYGKKLVVFFLSVLVLSAAVFFVAQLAPTDPLLAYYGERTEKMSVEVGAVRTGWSSYDELAIDFANPAVLGTSQSVTPKNWDDVWRYQVGVEYMLTEQFALRASYVYDNDPIPGETLDYLVPTNDRQLFSIGCGYAVNDWTIDAAYTYLTIHDRDITGRPEDGVYPGESTDGVTHMLGLSVSRKI